MRPVFKYVIQDIFPFSVSTVFSNSEQGAWFDPSDLTTMFQDSAGTTPVTAPAQTVGKMLDKSGRGNHATQATLGQRTIYGINPITGTRNLLTYTEEFAAVSWSRTNAAVTVNAAQSPTGTMTAAKLVATAATGEHSIAQGFTVVASTAHTFSCYMKAAEETVGVVWQNVLGGTLFNLTTGVVISGVAGSSITDAGNGWYRCSVPYTPSSTDGLVRIYPRQSTSYTGDGTSGILIWGAQVEQSAAATAYQKVVTQYEVTEAGVQSVGYIAFDGSDDGMVTGTITPAINKMQVFAGVRKLSDSAQGIVAEMSATIASNNGSFALTAPNSAAANYNFSSKGTTQTDNVVTTYTAPITSVISGLGDIAGASNLIRVNGAQVGSTLTTQGTGNYLAYALYLGRRGGASSPFNGRLYSLIVRFGPSLSSRQISQIEAYVAMKTGVIL